MHPANRRTTRLHLVAATTLLVAIVGATQSDVTSPAERFDKGLQFLKENKLSLIVEYIPKEGAGLTKHAITAYHEMVMLANKKVDTTVYLGLPSGEEKQVATIIGKEMPSKGLGAWLWYKVCAAADLIDGCRAAGVIS